ncbi:nuclear transport factor 2 family protein [Modestobacter sp. VKM Ac-2978]|uniref:nuclear transport factor 2 family protein n=1 Tax=Modestobacter sp. VKM Ac-2978 TaxID=3004132 RepID=UPI0022AA5550|nr:nuclear transport factor 2 family protein [Modestobacter sp. VKM Ac-2978]MCZ2849888.1 nuclear transport factor 2 family protein [Modestobacter sp. VKM Ac-2978]
MTAAEDARPISASEEARCQALLRADVPALRRMFHDRLLYTHASGVRDTKSAYLAKVENGYYVYLRLTHRVERVSVLGDTAIVVGRLSGDMTVQGAPRTFENLSLAVWTKSDGDWQLVAHGSTRPPAD